MSWLISVALALGIISAPTAMAQNVLSPHAWVLDARLTPAPLAQPSPLAIQSEIVQTSHARRGFAHLLAGAMVGAMVGLIVHDDGRVDPCIPLENEPAPCVGLPNFDDEPIVVGAFVGAASGLTIYLVRTLLPNKGT